MGRLCFWMLVAAALASCGSDGEENGAVSVAGNLVCGPGEFALGDSERLHSLDADRALSPRKWAWFQGL